MTVKTLPCTYWVSHQRWCLMNLSAAHLQNTQKYRLNKNQKDWIKPDPKRPKQTETSAQSYTDTDTVGSVIKHLQHVWFKRIKPLYALKTKWLKGTKMNIQLIFWKHSRLQFPHQSKTLVGGKFPVLVLCLPWNTPQTTRAQVHLEQLRFWTRKRQ